MKKQAEPDIVIEWNGRNNDRPATGIGSLNKDNLRALAQALGRMAARRDLARAAAQIAERDMISATSGAKVKVSA